MTQAGYVTDCGIDIRFAEAAQEKIVSLQMEGQVAFAALFKEAAVALMASRSGTALQGLGAEDVAPYTFEVVEEGNARYFDGTNSALCEISRSL